MMVCLVYHTNDSTSLAAVCSMHLHRLHHHLVLGTLTLNAGIIERLRVLLLLNDLNSSSGLGSPHQLLLVERAIKVLYHRSCLLK